MNKITQILTAGLLLLNFTVNAQIEKTNSEFNAGYVPLGNSDIAFKNVEFKVRLKTFILDENKTSFFRVGVSLSGADIEHKVDNPLFNKLENFYRPGLSLDYIKVWSKKWSFTGIVRPRLSSNFSTGITSDDFNIFGLAAFNYSRSEKSKFTFGIMYANTFGSSIPLPYFNYWKKMGENWEMNIGFPRTGVTRIVSNRSLIHGFLELQGFSANISENIKSSTFQENRTAERMNYKDSSVGLEYELRFNKWILKTKAGYTLKREFSLDTNDDEIAHEFKMDKNLFFGVGFGFNL